MGTKKESTKKSEPAKAAPQPAAKKMPVTKITKPAVKEVPSQEPVKKPVKKPAPKAVRKPVPARASALTISNDEIALRAYYIAERRQKLGIPGDSKQDWIEAERELIIEVRKLK